MAKSQKSHMMKRKLVIRQMHIETSRQLLIIASFYVMHMQLITGQFPNKSCIVGGRTSKTTILTPVYHTSAPPAWSLLPVVIK